MLYFNFACVCSYTVFVPHFYDLGVSRHDQIQLIMEMERFDWQVVEMVFNQQRLTGAQIIQQNL